MTIEVASVGRQNVVQGLNGTEVGNVVISVPHIKLNSASLQPTKVIDQWTAINLVAVAAGATVDILAAVAFKWYRIRKLVLVTDATHTAELFFGGVSKGFINIPATPSIILDLGDLGFALGVLNQGLAIKNNSAAARNYLGMIFYNELS